MNDLLQVGIIANTHGIKGEVKVYPTTDDINRFCDLKEVILDTGREQLVLEIENVKFFKKLAILKFKGYNNISDVEKYKGNSLLVTRDNAVPLDEGEFFITDLIGLNVENEDGKELGELIDVIQTGANDVYVVKIDDKEVLIPAIKQCILNVDIESRKMTVHIMKGLLE